MEKLYLILPSTTNANIQNINNVDLMKDLISKNFKKYLEMKIARLIGLHFRQSNVKLKIENFRRVGHLTLSF